ncbi:MAG: DUF2961 domain-containing protein [Sedimentisphaerales bacterium]|nr:DUF2961 domain-containing protein [Sedimentisphaerales bacterium]
MTNIDKLRVLLSILSGILLITGCASLPEQRANEDIPAIVLTHDYQTRRASSFDITGGNTDCIALESGQTADIATLEGPGIIKHMWFTVGFREYPDYLSKLVLRIRWDDATEPAVECPLGAFFGMGHDDCADFNSAMIVVMKAAESVMDHPPRRAAFNCYFPMAFQRKAIISIANTGDHGLHAFYYHIDYQKHKTLPENTCYFHARYRSEKTTTDELPDGKNTTAANNYVILDTQGKGHFVGCILNVEAHQSDKGKWYEGDDMMFIDGEGMPGAIMGTGGEDYFNMAWGVRRPFQSPYFGTCYHKWHENERDNYCWGTFSIYRWHIPDPISFEKSLKVTIEHGHNNDAENNFSSVAYWYATQP